MAETRVWNCVSTMWRGTGGSERGFLRNVDRPAPADPPEALSGEIRQMRSARGWDLLGCSLGQRFAYRSAGVDNALVEFGNLHLAAKLVDIDGDHHHEACGDYFCG